MAWGCVGQVSWDEQVTDLIDLVSLLMLVWCQDEILSPEVDAVLLKIVVSIGSYWWYWWTLADIDDYSNDMVTPGPWFSFFGVTCVQNVFRFYWLFFQYYQYSSMMCTCYDHCVSFMYFMLFRLSACLECFFQEWNWAICKTKFLNLQIVLIHGMVAVNQEDRGG